MIMLSGPIIVNSSLPQLSDARADVERTFPAWCHRLHHLCVSWLGYSIFADHFSLHRIRIRQDTVRWFCGRHTDFTKDCFNKRHVTLTLMQEDPGHAWEMWHRHPEWEQFEASSMNCSLYDDWLQTCEQPLNGKLGQHQPKFFFRSWARLSRR